MLEGQIQTMPLLHGAVLEVTVGLSSTTKHFSLSSISPAEAATPQT
jgi:hypothetical protein